MSEDQTLEEEDWRARAEAAEQRLQDALQTADARLIQAELRAEALRSGMVDPDGVKLLDAAALKLNEKGEIAGAAQLMQALKRAKPWLFGGQSSSSAAIPPPAQVPQHRLATEMNHQEWRDARALLLRRR